VSTAAALFAVFVGAGLGACGGYLVGVAIALFAWRSDLSPLWRLFCITGVLGGLTTFSTFSAEVVLSLERGQPGWALATAAAHLAGSLALTALGLWTVRAAIS
jgi:fluoride exporter